MTSNNPTTSDGNIITQSTKTTDNPQTPQAETTHASPPSYAAKDVEKMAAVCHNQSMRSELLKKRAFLATDHDIKDGGRLKSAFPCHKLVGAFDAKNGTNGSSHDDPPSLFHKVRNQRSILALAISDGKIFAGNQGGEILVWSLDNFEPIGKIQAHRGAVLALFIPNGGGAVFSSGGDAIVNVWSPQTLQRVYSIYSTYDVGDVFCVVYSSCQETVYLGAQNTSIQWYNLAQRHQRPHPDLNLHPSQRTHRFFDSKGPGGISTPRSGDSAEYFHQGGEVLDIDKDNILQYAHFGYVYCMILTSGLRLGSSEETLISGGGDGTIKFWDLGEKGAISPLYTLENGDDSILSMALNGMFLYTGRLDGDVDIWDLDTKQLIQTVNVYSGDVLTIQAAHGMMFTGGTNGHVKVLERFKTKHEWPAHEELILASAITSHNQRNFLVTGGNDDIVAIWDITDSTTGPATPSRASDEQMLRTLSQFVSFRSVSAKPEYAEDCRQAASFLRTLLKERGAATRLLSTEDGWNPVVYGRFKGKNESRKRTLFYGHYDVVSAENKAGKWRNDPFRLNGQDGYLYGRGVSDNKGPILSAIFAVADLFSEQRLENDVVFLIEGEEEFGSRGFEETVKKHSSLIGSIDYILLANSYWLTDSIPCLTYGLRGVVHATIHVDSGREDLHSGVSGSWLVSEPLKDLTTLLSLLSGKENRINIPSFYDHILSITRSEDALYNDISTTLSETSIHHKPHSAHGDMSADALKAKWREPSLTIHSFKTSSGNNATVIPHRASASISLRLVPNQGALEIQKSLVDHLQSQFASLKTTNTLRIETNNPADPWLGDPQNDIFQTLERAVIDVWGLGTSPAASKDSAQPLPKRASKQLVGTLRNGQTRSNSGQVPLYQTVTPPKPMYIREGGSIPAIRFLEKEFGAPAAQLPIGQASDNAHLDNERLRVLNLYNSRKIFRRVFRELGTDTTSA